MGRNCCREDWVLAAAARLNSGAPAASIQALAADLKVTEGSFYHHFKGRAELYRAVAAWRAGPDAARQLAAELDGILGPAERLRRMHAVWQRSARLDAALRQMAGEDPEIAAAVLAADEAAARAVTAAFTELGFRRRDARLRALMLISLSRAQHAGMVPAAATDFNEAIGLLAAPRIPARAAARAAARGTARAL